MTQSDMGNMESPMSGTEFINTKLEPWAAAVKSNHSGNAAPSYITEGMMWINTNTNPWVVYIYDGAQSVEVGTINTTTHVYTPTNAGTGDASTNTAVSVANELPLFADTSGKLFKRSTLTGLLKSASGVVSAAAAGTDYYAPGSTDVAVADGGTGRSSHTAYAVICGGTTATDAQQSIASVGTSGQVLTSNGASALPTFQAASATGRQLQVVSNSINTFDSTTTAFPWDNTVPQNTEGKEFITQAITPQNASSMLDIFLYAVVGANGSVGFCGIGLFADSVANAIKCAVSGLNATLVNTISLRYRISATNTSARTYKGRYGANAGTCSLNGDTALRYNGKMESGIIIEEIL